MRNMRGRGMILWFVAVQFGWLTTSGAADNCDPGSDDPQAEAARGKFAELLQQPLRLASVQPTVAASRS